MKTFFACLSFATLAGPAYAGDPVAGEAVFNTCKACHAIIAPDGTVVRKGGKIGPNLYGVIGRQIGAAPDYTFSAASIAAGADGTRWDEPMVVAWLSDPSRWLQTKTGNDAAKSKMVYSLSAGGADVAAYLATFASPAN